MAITYQKADAGVMAIVKAVMKQYHPDLIESEAKVGVLMADNVDGEGKVLPAVKLHGVECYAIIRKTNLRDRTQGMPDAQIIIDHHKWDQMYDGQHEALLDHELHHLECQRHEDSGVIKTDDLGRPIFKMRLHDHDFGWFDCVVRRHGDASIEMKQAKTFADEMGQLYFGWKSPPASGSVEHSPTPTVPHAAVMAAAKS